jgi:hypothetical protein
MASPANNHGRRGGLPCLLLFMGRSNGGWVSESVPKGRWPAARKEAVRNRQDGHRNREGQTARLSRKVGELRQESRRRMHLPLVEQQPRLRSVLLSYYRYDGLPSNFRALSSFRDQVRRLWWRSRWRRSQRHQSWSAFREVERLFPPPRPQMLRVHGSIFACLG